MENFKISESSFTPSSTVFFGDYTNIAALNGKIYPIWMRLEGMKLSIWMTTIEEQVSILPNNGRKLKREIQFLSSFTNPTSNQTAVNYKLSKPTVVDVSVFNINGQKIETISNELKSAGTHTAIWNAGSFGAGIYFYKITVGGYSDFVKCVVAR